MFERFTEDARQVVVLAQDEARQLRHNYIGTEHLLLGVLRYEEGPACRILAGLGVSLESARAEVGRIVGPGDEAATGQIPFTPRAKKVMELALRESLSLGHNYIGGEHLLLALVREREGVAARILFDCGVDTEAIREEVRKPCAKHPRVPDPPQRRPRWLARRVGEIEARLSAIEGRLSAIEQHLRPPGPQ